MKKDVVHGIVYSMLLLNTDLHIVNINASFRRMSKKEYIKNTLDVLVENMANKNIDEKHKTDEEVLPFLPGISDPTQLLKWKKDIESMLKEIYNNISKERFLQRNVNTPRSSPSSMEAHDTPTSTTSDKLSNSFTSPSRNFFSSKGENLFSSSSTFKKSFDIPTDSPEKIPVHSAKLERKHYIDKDGRLIKFKKWTLCTVQLFVDDTDGVEVCIQRDEGAADENISIVIQSKFETPSFLYSNSTINPIVSH